MKLSDVVAKFVADNSNGVVFGYQGTSVSHLIDSICLRDDLKYINVRNEQAAAFAACGYALTSGNVGIGVACSGPGATNLITGIANAYYDSIPCIFFTGQVSTFEMRKNMNIRQLGFQETDITAIVKPITKYAVTIDKPDNILYELEKAYYTAVNGRKGPVVIDLPHNIQSMQVEMDKLKHFYNIEKKYNKEKNEKVLEEFIRVFNNSLRPVIILGGGARTLKDNKKYSEKIENLGIPIVTSYRARDFIDNRKKNYCGTIGAFGNRVANWAVNYSDCVLVLGSRLDGRQTGDGQNQFASEAKVLIVDLDSDELDNMPARYKKVNGPIEDYIEIILDSIKKCQHNVWMEKLYKYKIQFPISDEYQKPLVNPNKFITTISSYVDNNCVVSADVGQNQMWVNTSFLFKKTQNFLQSCGHGTMGFSLPACIGGYLFKKVQCICFCGDGGLQMNIQELQTIECYKIPMKVFVFNNSSLGLIRVYQDKVLGGRKNGSVDGFGSPNYEYIAKAYSMDYYQIKDNNFDNDIKDILQNKKACLVEVIVSQESTNYPEPTYKSKIINQSKELGNDLIDNIRRELYELK